MGVFEYWVADLPNNRLLQYSALEAGAYRTKREFHAGDSIAPQLLPSCRLDAGVLLPQ
jgi:Uma2 family endonuclease